MIRRKLVAASLFFTVFGALAYLPPLILLLRYDVRVFGVPVETVYVFVLWIALVVGARWFSSVLPDDRSPSEKLPEKLAAGRRETRP